MNDYFECSCSSKEHMFCVTSEYSEDEYAPELFFHFQLINNTNFLQKLKTAIKYLFGYKCRYGHWDVINLSEDDTNRMIVLLHQHRARMDKFHREMEKKNDRTN